MNTQTQTLMLTSSLHRLYSPVRLPLQFQHQPQKRASHLSEPRQPSTPRDQSFQRHRQPSRSGLLRLVRPGIVSRIRRAFRDPLYSVSVSCRCISQGKDYKAESEGMKRGRYALFSISFGIPKVKPSATRASKIIGFLRRDNGETVDSISTFRVKQQKRREEDTYKSAWPRKTPSSP
jgi:hypothetical protein